MNIEKIEVENVRPAFSDKQREIGILGTFNINFVAGDGTTVLQIKEATLRTSKAGVDYICPPFRTYRPKNAERDSRVYHWWLYPDTENSQRDQNMKPLIDKVKQELSSQGSNNSSSQQTASTTSGSSMSEDLF